MAVAEGELSTVAAKAAAKQSSPTSSAGNVVSNMSHRQSILLVGIVGIVGVRLLASGKAKRAWDALWSAGESKSSVQPGQTYPMGGGVTGTVVGGSDYGGVQITYPPGKAPAGAANQFGFTPSYQKQQTGWLSQDRTLQGDASMEYNLGTGGESKPLDVPVGMTYKELKAADPSQTGGLGGYEQWQIESGPYVGGIFTFLHTLINNIVPGATVKGGTNVGKTGWPTASKYAVGGVTGPANAHLAIIVDPKSEAAFGLNPNAFG